MSLADTAKRMIKDSGRAVSIKTAVITLGDASKPWGDAADTTTYTLQNTYGAFFDENARDLQARLSGVSRLVLSPVENSTSQVYIASQGLTAAPQISDTLVDGDVEWEIKQVGEISPGTTSYVYILKVGR